MVNILIVHEVDWLNKVVFEIHNTAEQMSLLGHQVFAIDYEDRWQRENIFNLLSLKTREFPNVSRTVPGASVHLIRPGFIRIPGVSRLSAAFTHYGEIRRVLKEKNIDVILLYSVPTNGLQTVYLARKLGIPVVFRSIDILHRLVRYPLLRPITRFLEKRVYLKVDKILAIAPRYVNYLLQMGVPEAKIKLVLMPIDTSLFRPREESGELRQKWGLAEGDKVIVFIGTLFEFCGLDRFISLLPGIVAEVPQARLLIVGDGPQRPKLERLIAKLNLERHVIITGFQPYPTMPQYINMAALCINTFLNTRETTDIFPGKILQYLACGKATVATPLRGITSIVPGESGGVVYADLDDMGETVVNLLKLPPRRRELGQAGLEYIQRNHSYELISRQFEEELLAAIEQKDRTQR